MEGAAKFETMGMAAQKWLPLAGDMAAATNKSFDQATEALIDAQNGELNGSRSLASPRPRSWSRAKKCLPGCSW